MYQDAAQPQVRQLATELFTDRHDYLLAIARRNAHTEADAAEALQEAFASFIAKFDPQRGAPPLAWLTLTLKRQCWRQRREARLDRHYGQEAESGGEQLGSFLERLSSLELEPAERVDRARRSSPPPRQVEASRASHPASDRRRLLLPRRRPDHRLVPYEDQPLRRRGPRRSARRGSLIGRSPTPGYRPVPVSRLVSGLHINLETVDQHGESRNDKAGPRTA